ncbi:MAG: class I SAM-dependent methyltransferase [Promethearchaeota archaeon]
MKYLKNCPICFSQKLTKLKEYKFKYPGNDIYKNLLNISYVRLWILFSKILKKNKQTYFYCFLCNNCGFIFLNPRFTEEELELKYKIINQIGSVKFRLKKHPLINLNKRVTRIHRLINKYYKKKEKFPKILDYGGASGYILTPFIEQYECYVIDYEKWPMSKGIKYLGKQLSNIPPNKKFDVILLLHILEHVINPRNFIKNVQEYLNEDGIVYIEIPLGCVDEWNHLKDPLTHFNFFSEQSIYNCLKINNLKIIYLKTAYQWVSHGKMWCINIIAQKSKKKSLISFKNIKSTKQQMFIYKFFYELFEFTHSIKMRRIFLFEILSSLRNNILNKIHEFKKKIKEY